MTLLKFCSKIDIRINMINVFFNSSKNINIKITNERLKNKDLNNIGFQEDITFTLN